MAIVGVLSAIATATVLNARMSGNEASAIGSLRAVTTAQIDYNGLNRGYAVNLKELATLCPGFQVTFLSADLGINGVTKSGFVFTMAPGDGAVAAANDCNGVPTQSAFYVSATPVSIGLTGKRAFAASQVGTIWQDTMGVAPTEPFTAGATVSPIGR